MDFLGKQGIPWEVSKPLADLFPRLITRRSLFLQRVPKRHALRDTGFCWLTLAYNKSAFRFR
jgi:hypothetical protein